MTRRRSFPLCSFLSSCSLLVVACVKDFDEHGPDAAYEDASAQDADSSAQIDGASPRDAGSAADGSTDDAARTLDAEQKPADADAGESPVLDAALVGNEGGFQDAPTSDGASASDGAAQEASVRDGAAPEASVPDTGLPDAGGGVCGAQLSCGATCAPRSFGFEGGTLSGTYLYDSVSMGLTTPLTSTTTLAHGGSRSVSLGIQVDPGEIGYFVAEIPLCVRPQTTPQAGATVSAYIYFDGPALPADVSISLHWSAPGFYGATGHARMGQVLAKQWALLSGPVNVDNTNLFGIGVTVTFRAPWTGTIYFDDVTVQ